MAPESPPQSAPKANVPPQSPPKPTLRDRVAAMPGDDFQSPQRLAQGLRKTTTPGPVAGDIAGAFRADPEAAAAEFSVIRDELSKFGTPEQVKNLDAGVRAELTPGERARFDELLADTDGGVRRPPFRDFLLRRGEEAPSETLKLDIGRDEDPRANVPLAEKAAEGGQGGQGGQGGKEAGPEDKGGIHNRDGKAQKEPWPETPMSKRFRDEIHKRESQKRNYREISPDGKALGRYQLTPTALQEIGMMDADGNWTGKHGVQSPKDFRENPIAQEKAFAELMKKNEDSLQKNGATQHEGTAVNGIEGKFEVTRSGLLAAAHREGASRTREYLEHQQRHGWKSDAATFPDHLRRSFLSVETRLREFSRIDHRR